jgi:hypothetical protein
MGGTGWIVPCTVSTKDDAVAPVVHTVAPEMPLDDPLVSPISGAATSLFR